MVLLSHLACAWHTMFEMDKQKRANEDCKFVSLLEVADCCSAQVGVLQNFKIRVRQGRSRGDGSLLIRLVAGHECEVMAI